jgi:hypothetical protein
MNCGKTDKARMETVHVTISQSATGNSSTREVKSEATPSKLLKADRVDDMKVWLKLETAWKLTSRILEL